MDHQCVQQVCVCVCVCVVCVCVCVCVCVQVDCLNNPNLIHSSLTSCSGNPLCLKEDSHMQLHLSVPKGPHNVYFYVLLFEYTGERSRSVQAPVYLHGEYNIHVQYAELCVHVPCTQTFTQDTHTHTHTHAHAHAHTHRYAHTYVCTHYVCILLAVMYQNSKSVMNSCMKLLSPPTIPQVLSLCCIKNVY